MFRLAAIFPLLLQLRSEASANLLIFTAILLVLLTISSLVAFYLYQQVVRNRRREHELNQRIMAVFHSTDSLILSLDDDTRIRFVSNSARDFFKKWVGIILHPGDVLLETVTGTLAHSEILEWQNRAKELKSWSEIRKIQMDGEEIYLHQNISSIRADEDNRFSGLVLVANDITLQQKNNIKVTAQRDKLAASDNAKQRMLSILAHDLKDAVYSAHSVSGLVKEEPESFEKNDLVSLLGLMHGNFERTKDLLEELLNWIRTQSGAMRPEFEDIPIKDLMQAVAEACGERLQRKEVRCEVEAAEHLKVYADPTMIKTVLRNLISNAIKYSEQKKGLIQVSAFEADGEVEIHVKDNGRGMNRELQERIFESPGEVSLLGTNNESGTGFGISLSMELLKINNSRLQVNSVPGEGTDFFFRLPMVAATAEK